MPGVPPVPIPNTAVKPRAADGSRTLGPARVGRCQVYSPEQAKARSGLLRVWAPMDSDGQSITAADFFAPRIADSDFNAKTQRTEPRPQRAALHGAGFGSSRLGVKIRSEGAQIDGLMAWWGGEEGEFVREYF